MTVQYKTLVPQYLKEFSCIGSAYEDTCCSGWRINIDQTTYKKYKKVRDPKWRAQFDQQVKRNRENPDEDRYAYLELDEHKNCTFLSEERLCRIQLTFGESYLSHVCSTYPRSLNIVGNQFERAGTFSCPEMARLALLDPKGIEFDEEFETLSSKELAFYQIDPSAHAENELEGYFWKLRVFTIQIIQNRDYRLQDRMILLGLFFSKLQEYVELERVQEVPTLIESYQSMFENGSLRSLLEEIPSNSMIQMELIKEIIDERFVSGVNHKRYVETYGKVLQGLHYDGEAVVADHASSYNKAYEMHYRPFMDSREYIIENYLVNHVYKNLFPFMKFPTPFDNYVMLVVHYAMIKLHLIGVAGCDQGLDEESIIFTLQSFSKVSEHNPFFLKQIFDLLQKNGFNNMAYMSILIKN